MILFYLYEIETENMFFFLTRMLARKAILYQISKKTLSTRFQKQSEPQNQSGNVCASVCQCHRNYDLTLSIRVKFSTETFNFGNYRKILS